MSRTSSSSRGRRLKSMQWAYFMEVVESVFAKVQPSMIQQVKSNAFIYAYKLIRGVEKKARSEEDVRYLNENAYDNLPFAATIRYIFSVVKDDVVLVKIQDSFLEHLSNLEEEMAMIYQQQLVNKNEAVALWLQKSKI